MIHPPDTEAMCQFVREHQAELKRDMALARAVRPEAVESRGQRRRLQLRRLRIRLRPAGDLSCRSVILDRSPSVWACRRRPCAACSGAAFLRQAQLDPSP